MRKWLAPFMGLIMPLAALPALAQGTHYGEGSVIGAEVFVTDKDGSRVGLQALLAQHPDQLTVMFIFGGDLGSGQTGVRAEPLRGNIYHPHGGEVRINYTFGDIDALLQDLLAAR